MISILLIIPHLYDVTEAVKKKPRPRPYLRFGDTKIKEWLLFAPEHGGVRKETDRRESTLAAVENV